MQTPTNDLNHPSRLAKIDDPAAPGLPWQDPYAHALGIEAYIWGFPWIYLSQLAWLWTSPEGKLIAERANQIAPSAPMNSFWRAPGVAAPDQQSVGGSPNADTLYATAWLDLSREPLVLSVPEVNDRFYAIQMASLDSDNFAYVGTVATGTAANNYLIAGPGWFGHVPPDVLDVLPRSRTPVAFVLGRTEVLGENDAIAQKIQAQYQLTPLSRWIDPKLPPEEAPKAMVPDGLDYNDTTGAWLTMNKAMTRNPPGVPPGIEQRSLIDLFATIGIGPGQQLEAQSQATLQGLQTGAQAGLTLIKQMSVGRGKQVNGWTYPPLDTGRAGQVGDYITRSAIQALGGIVANDPNQSVYLNASVDAKGNPLGKGQYAIAFASAGDMPPIVSEYHGFWSITLYDAVTHNFIQKTANYTWNSHDPKYQARLPSGGVKILIQREQPALSPGVYWLQTPPPPAPGEDPNTFYLVLRIYAPKPAVSGSQTWSPPEIMLVG